MSESSHTGLSAASEVFCIYASPSVTLVGSRFTPPCGASSDIGVTLGFHIFTIPLNTRSSKTEWQNRHQKMNLSRSTHKSRCAMNHMSPVHRLTDIHRNLQHSCRVRSYSSSGCVPKRELLRISHQRKIAHCLSLFLPSVLWRCWLGSRKGIRPVKNEWWGVGVVICLELGADLYMAQLMPLPLTVSCFSKIQIGFTFLVPAHPGSPGKRAVKRVCVCVCLILSYSVSDVVCLH